jgi:hypothetical protein
MTKHGLSKTDVYRIWRHMRSRCENPNVPEFFHYGGRGIAVCERWKQFEAFLQDVGPRPGPEFTIDRIDNNRGYEPGNCRWATWKQQQRNRRSNVIYSYAGITAPLAEICERLNLKYRTVHARLVKGASLDVAMTPGSLPKGKGHRIVKTGAVTVRRLLERS